MNWGKVKHIPRGESAVWVIEAQPQLMSRLKRIFPRVQTHRTKTLSIADTLETSRDLEWVLERWPMTLEPEDAATLRRRAKAHREREEKIERILDGHVPPAGDGWLELSSHFERRPEQYQAADLCLTTGSLLLGDVVGYGKTLTSLLVLRNPAALPALIVTLTHLPTQWLAELGEAFPMLRGHILRTGTPYDIAERREMRGHEPDVLISNYAKLPGWADYLAGKVKTVIFDEAHELRRHGESAASLTEKYKAAGKAADEADYVMGLSGTPVYNYGAEIFNVMDVIAPGALGTREEFNREWGRSLGNGKLGVRDPKALGRHLRSEGLFLRRTWESGEMDPHVIPHVIDADEDVYQELAGDAVELARIILSSSDKREVFKASGRVDWVLRQATGLAKAPFVADFTRMLLEQGEAVLLFGWHHAVYDIWRERLSDYEPAFYTGEESKAQKLEAERRFTDGETKLLIMSLRSGAGLDGLQKVSNIAVFGELDWSPRMHDQCLGRLDPRRSTPPGEKPALGYFLHSSTGTDPHMVETLDLKNTQSRPIVDPDAPLLEEVPDHSGHIRELAASFLGEEAVAA